MHLYIYTPNSELRTLYYEAIYHHNRKKQNEKFPDAGFDLLVPEEKKAYPNKTLKLDHEVMCAAYSDSKNRPMSYYMYPRSSLSKTPLRLANSVGIIDSGYRGPLIAMLDNKSDTAYDIEKNKKLLQICAPNLEPIKVTLADTLEQLGNTERGDGGFGSTGNTNN